MSFTPNLERISGPFNGFYIVSSAVAYADCWIGQAKLFSYRPDSGNDPDYELFIGGDRPEPTAGEAIQHIEQRARTHILSSQPRVMQVERPPERPGGFLRPAFANMLGR